MSIGIGLYLDVVEIVRALGAFAGAIFGVAIFIVVPEWWARRPRKDRR